jgi:hypothetical protein
MATIRPEVTIRTTTNGDGGQAPTVVAGYGTDPAAAVRDLTSCAKAAARELLRSGAGQQFEVIGVRLVAGEVPDNASDDRRATRPGWAAYGTLTAVAAAAGRRAG